MQANLAEVPSTSAADGAAAAPVSAARAAAAAAGGTMPAGAASAPGAAGSNAFVINLVSSTTPVVLTRPDHAGLKRFTFFVSRRREDGRERFRLHMGYFDTQEEAEKLLDIVRTIYPGAWAGLAPGRRLAAGGAAAVAGPTAAAASAEAAPQSVPASTSTSAPAAPTPAPTPVAAPMAAAGSVSSPSTVRVVAKLPGAGRGTAQPAAPVSVPPAAPRALPRASEAPPLALVPDEGRRQLSDVTLDLEGDGEGEGERRAARRSFSNVRDTIAALADNAIRAPALSEIREIPELKPAVIPVARPVLRPAQARPAGDKAELTDTATLRLLETGNPAQTAKPQSEKPQSEKPQGAKPESAKPERAKTQSAPAPREEKPWYAVQLMWAVQPIALAQIPQLAIFSAYTLYGAEGNRDGRRWYGLRLGFFTDAVSAKQVAHYVRGDFATVSVVPVTAREREHARQAVIRSTPSAQPGASGQTTEAMIAGATAAGAAAARVKEPEFAFIEGTDSQITRLRPGSKDAAIGSRAAPPPAGARAAGTALVGGKRPSRGAPGKRAKPRPPGQVHARAHAKPRTLEETLEILGAGELQVADGSGGLLGDSNSLLNDAGVPHPKSGAARAKSSSKLSRLIDRLAERIGN